MAIDGKFDNIIHTSVTNFYLKTISTA